MTRINLLDWRSARRERRKREFYVILAGSLALAVAIVLVAMGWLDAQIQNQQARNQYLRQQIAQINQQIRKIQNIDRLRNSLASRMEVIEQLQENRSSAVHFFDEIVNTLPDGVYLTSLSQRGNEVTLDGMAESNGSVSAYMNNLNASPWFSDPRLVVIKTGKGGGAPYSAFTLRVKNLTRAATTGGGS